jgi:hypothetical protein
VELVDAEEREEQTDVALVDAEPADDVVVQESIEETDESLRCETDSADRRCDDGRMGELGAVGMYWSELAEDVDEE